MPALPGTSTAAPSIGKCVYHTERDQFITVLRTGETKKINRLNTTRQADELVLYTPQYAASTGTDNSGVEVRVEMKRPALVLPAPAMALGRIVKIRDLQGNTPLLFDEVVLSASGVARDALLSKIVDGDEIGISQEISNCASSPQSQLVQDLCRHRRRLPLPDRRRADHRYQQSGRQRAQLAHCHRL